MFKLSIATLLLITAASLGLAQDPAPTTNTATTNTAPTDEILKQAHAPSQPGGIGRAVLVVEDKGGNPIKGAYAKLESVWGGDNLCESWNWSNDKGVMALNPIHMGTLKLVVKAKGFATQKLEIEASSLSEPVHVTLTAK
jgi:hypothetical protein